jgi:hypothetical protein
VRCLVGELGADVQQARTNGATPLCVAASFGHTAMLRLLGEELGANVGQLMRSGKSPLILAAKAGHLDAVVCLISELGADPSHADEDRRTALEHARSAGNQSIVAAIEAAAQANLRNFSAEGKNERASVAVSSIEATKTALQVPTADGVEESPKNLLLVTQKESEKQKAFLLVMRKEAQEMRRKSDLLEDDLKVASARFEKKSAAFVTSFAAKEQENIALAASVIQLQQTLTKERRQSEVAKTDAVQSNKNFKELLTEEARKDKQHLEAQLSRAKRDMQAQTDAEQKRLQGLLAQAKEQVARMEQEAVEETFSRQHLEQEAMQGTNERMRLEQELNAARALAAVSVAERLPTMQDLEVCALEEAAHEEKIRRRLQRDVQREVQRAVQRAVERERELMREARLCEICLDNFKDVALSCGHQACAGCADGLANCHICHQIVTARMRLYF